MSDKLDFVIVGSGIAGLQTALLAAEHGRVMVLTKSGLTETNTNYAQGGIAALRRSNTRGDRTLLCQLEKTP